MKIDVFNNCVRVYIPMKAFRELKWKDGDVLDWLAENGQLIIWKREFNT